MAPRTLIESLTYISFGSNNPGIVLDISEGGLRFRVLSPIQEKEQPLHFWFSAEGQRVDAQGELMWVDEKQVTGGLRFSSVSAETRQHIRQLVCQANPALPSADFTAKRKLLSAVAADDPVALEPVRFPSRTEKRQKLGVFARGLLCGLALATVVVSGILLHVERGHFGAALIKAGEWLTAKSSPSGPSAAPQSSATAVVPDASLSPNPGGAASGNAKRPEVIVQEPAVVVAGVSPATPMPMADPRRSPALISPAPVSNPASGIPDSTVETEAALKPQPNNDSLAAAERAGERIGNATPGSNKYLDFREFRQKASAEKMSETLGQAGFHTSVTHRGHLFLSSYHVMVGPYTSDTEVETARNDLESRGFRPESRSRLSRRFTLPAMTLADKDTVVKDCVISWDPNSSAATVTFVKGESVVLKTQGKWVKRVGSFKLDAVLSDSNNRGPLTLLEIQCHGMNQALVLDAANPVLYFVPPFRANL